MRNSLIRLMGTLMTFSIFPPQCNLSVIQRYIPLYAEPKTTEIHRGTPRPRFEFRSLTTRVIELFENYEFES